MAGHYTQAVKELEDCTRVEHGTPSLRWVLPLAEELETFKVADDTLVLRQLIDETPHGFAELWRASLQHLEYGVEVVLVFRYQELGVH